MRLVQAIASSMLSCAGAVQGQTMLNQFSVPFDYQYNVPFFEFSQFAAPDVSGGMLLFALTDSSLRRFDSTGKQLWSAAFNFGSAQGVVAAMAVTADGVLLGGQVTGALPGQTSSGSYDAFAAKYDSNGNNLWIKQFGTANGECTRAIAINARSASRCNITAFCRKRSRCQSSLRASESSPSAPARGKRQ
jgi:hypothetical protein